MARIVAAWLGAMRSELKSMDENQVWNLIDLPDGARPIKCKWVFKKKADMDGNVSVYKERLVEKGSNRLNELTMMRPSLP